MNVKVVNGLIKNNINSKSGQKRFVNNIKWFQENNPGKSPWDAIFFVCEPQRAYLQDDASDEEFMDSLKYFCDMLLKNDSWKKLFNVNEELKEEPINEAKYSIALDGDVPETMHEDTDDAKEYKAKWVDALNNLENAYNELRTLMTTAGFDANEFINTKDARNLMDNSFAKKSLDELEIDDWCDAVKSNLEKWKPGEWLEEDKEIDDGPEHGYASEEEYKRAQDILDEMSKLRKEEEEKGSKLLKAWAVEKTMSDEEFSKQSDELHKTVQDKEDALYKELCSLGKKSAITEAPDDDGILNDDELDAEEQKERDEMEARFKARRDKVAQQRADRDAKLAKEQELKAKADEIVAQIGDDWSFDKLFDLLVPESGKCDTLAGEIIRAINKIDYRWYNDGDRFFEDYGIETCGQPALFLANVEIDAETPFYDSIIMAGENNYDGNYYDRWVEDMKKFAVDTIKANPNLLATETTDMYDIKVSEVEEWLDDHNLIPYYDVDCSIPTELERHLDKGNISERDLIWEIESWIDNIGGSHYDDITIDWGNVYVSGCNKNVYDELDNGNTLYDWLEDYAHELDDEYGDPDEEEEEPEEEESEEEGEE